MTDPMPEEYVDRELRNAARAVESDQRLYERVPLLEPLDGLLGIGGTIRTEYEAARSALWGELYDRKGDTTGMVPLDDECKDTPLTATWLELRADLLRAARRIDHLVYGTDPALDF